MPNGRDLRTLQQLCLTEFKINLYTIPSYRYTGNSSGSAWSGLYYLEEGSAEIHTALGTIPLSPGDFYYIPCKYRYTANSRGGAPLKYYLIHFKFREVNGSLFDSPYDLTKIETMDSGAAKRKIAKIFADFSGNDVEKLTAVSDFYALFAEILPCLNQRKPLKLHHAIRIATDYIDAHLTENFTITDLAKIAFVSESRLYHLFAEQLKITPIGYKNRLKIIKSFELLVTTDLSVNEIADRMNFNSATYYRKVFKQETGVTPLHYRRTFHKSLGES